VLEQGLDEAVQLGTLLHDPRSRAEALAKVPYAVAPTWPRFEMRIGHRVFKTQDSESGDQS